MDHRTVEIGISRSRNTRATFTDIVDSGNIDEGSKSGSSMVLCVYYIWPCFF